MDKIKCIRCGTENNVDYNFCMNCGANLPRKEKEYTRQYASFQSSNEAVNEVLDFDGVSATEMTAYVGKNSDKVLPKFYNMQKYNQRVSFCFPPFILGLLFGFTGISMWCFYRKMKKLGIISLALGLFLFFGDLIVNYAATSQLVSGCAHIFNNLLLDGSNSFNQDFAATALGNLIAQYDNSYIGIFSFLNQYFGSIICPVLIGMFGFHFYKTKGEKDIKKLKEQLPEEMLLTGIASKGGTSNGLLAIPIVCRVLSFIIYFVSLLLVI